MTFPEIIKTITNSGMGVVFAGYYILKDWTQTKTIIKTLADMEKVLSILKDKLHIEDKEGD